MSLRGRRRRWLLISAAGVAVILVMYFVIPMAAAPFVRAKLQAMIAEQLNAHLSMGRLTYLPPYGVSVSDARLTAPDSGGEVEIFTARSIRLKLVKLPLGKGPLLIQSLRLDHPAVHLVRTTNGWVGRNVAQQAHATAVHREKLSDLFELRKLLINGGSIIYEDRAAVDNPPMAWRDLNLNLDLQPKSSGEYGFSVRSGDGSVAAMQAEGSIDIDDLLLRIRQSQVRVKVDPAAKSSPLPGEIQRLLHDYAVGGNLVINVAGSVPLLDSNAGHIASTLELSDATARLPGADAPIENLSGKITCLAEPARLKAGSAPRPRLRFIIERAAARGPAGTAAEVFGGSLAINTASRAWGIDDLRLSLSSSNARKCLPPRIGARLDQVKATGKVALSLSGSGPLCWPLGAPDQLQCDLKISPTDVVLQLPSLPAPLHDFGDFHVRLAGGIATFEALRAGYGDDVLFIRQVSLPIGPLPARIDLQSLAGAITFDADKPTRYPATIAEAFSQARPRGPFFFDGSAALHWADAQGFAGHAGTEPKLDYHLHITTMRGGISTARYHIPLYNLHADILATPRAIDISQFDADALTGAVSLSGHIDLQKQRAYHGQLRLRRLDLNQLAQVLIKPGERPMTVSGELSADSTFDGRAIHLDNALNDLQAQGAIEINHGALFQVPVLSDIAQKAHLHDAGTVGQAACTFSLADRRVHLAHIAIGAPAMGVQGAGDVALDGALDLNVIATGFNDWDRDLRQNDNAVANVAASVAGLVQKGFDTVTRELIYRMHVGGTVQQPQMNVIAAPVVQGGG
jgi:hypothetical protein